jgi:hypothetical protein
MQILESIRELQMLTGKLLYTYIIKKGAQY